MTEQPGHLDGVDRDTASLTASGDVRKGIEIVTSQDMPNEWTPPSMGLGGTAPTASADQDAGSTE